jgi:hypothetical protein
VKHGCCDRPGAQQQPYSKDIVCEFPGFVGPSIYTVNVTRKTCLPVESNRTNSRPTPPQAPLGHIIMVRFGIAVVSSSSASWSEPGTLGF